MNGEHRENTITKQAPDELVKGLPQAIIPEVAKRMGTAITTIYGRLLNSNNHMHREAWQMVRVVIEDRIKQGEDFLELLNSIPDPEPAETHEVGGEG